LQAAASSTSAPEPALTRPDVNRETATLTAKGSLHGMSGVSGLLDGQEWQEELS